MKKALTVLLTALMLLGMLVTAFAYDEEITFQGIPWGSSFDAVIEKLYESGLVDSSVQLIPKKAIGLETTMAEDGTLTQHYLDNHADEALYSIYISNPQISIAGYPISEMAFQFAANEEQSELICVTLKTEEQRDKAVYDTVTAELSSVYGKGTEKQSFGQWGDPCTVYEGAEKTAVTFHKNGMAYYNILQFGKLDSLEILLGYLK